MSNAPPSGGHEGPSAFTGYLRRTVRIGLSVVFFGIIMGFLLRPVRVAEAAVPNTGEEYRHELHTYILGFILALVLTLIPFGLVYWTAMPALALSVAIGAFAVVQAIVHFRCFLHIDPPRQNMDDLHLILFSSLLLLFMVGGTIWILANLATRMH